MTGAIRTRVEPFIIPAVVTALICLACSWFLEYQDRLHQRENQATWESEARQAADMLRARHSLSAQGERFGFMLRERAGRAIRRQDRYPASRSFATAFRQTFPRSWQGTMARQYLLSLDSSGNGSLVDGFGLATENGRAITRVVNSFLTNRADNPRAQKSSATAGKMAQSLLGPYCDPATIGRYFRGRLVPGKHLGRKIFFLWDYLEWAGRPQFAYLLVFPGVLETQARPFLTALRSIERQFRGRLIPGFLNRKYGESGLITASPQDQIFAAWEAYIADPAVGPHIPHDVAITHGGRRFFRTALTEELPQEILIAGTIEEQNRSTAGITLVWRSYLLFWSVLLLVVVVLPEPPFISLQVKFALNFFLVGLFSLLVLNLAGYSRNATWARATENRLVREQRELFDEWQESESVVLRRFLETARQAFRRRTFWRAFLHADPHRRSALARQLFEVFLGQDTGLDFFLVLEPNREGTWFSRQASFDTDAQTYLDFYSPIVSFFLKAYHLPDQIPLSPFQQTFALTLQTFLTFPQAAFVDLLRVGDVVKAGNEDSYFNIAEIIAEEGRPRLFLVLRVQGTRECRRHILREVLARNTATRESRLFLAKIEPGGHSPLVPDERDGFWRTPRGREVRSLMGRTALEKTDHRRKIAGGILATTFCPVGGGLVIGALIPTAELRSAVIRANLFPAGVSVVCLLLLTLVGIGISRHLLKPLAEVEAGLAEVCRGNLAVRLEMDRPDELGDFSRQCDHMIVGFHQRRELGRFVSGNLEDSLAAGSARSADQLSAKYGFGTVLTSDIRNFTTISESHPPQKVVEILNRHMETMSEAIRRAGGKIDKFIGDAIIAVFSDGTPAEQAERAIQAGMAMRRAMTAIQREGRNGLDGVIYEIGVGIDSGTLLTAPLGEGERLDFLIFGPPRDGSEQMEILSKQGSHSRVVVSPQVRALIATGWDFHSLADGAGFELIIPPAAMA